MSSFKMAALVLLRLSRETGEDVWKARAESQLTFLRRAVPMAQAMDEPAGGRKE